MYVLGHAQERRPHGIAVNALWPRTVIHTAALQMIPGVKPEHCRTPEIMADAAYAVLKMPASVTGNVFIDDEVLAKAGAKDLGKYSVVPGSAQLMPDLFL
jgi:citronellol/citronellal dehydrogenase